MSEINLPFIEREINGTLYRATTLKLDQWAALTESLASLLGEPMASILRGDAVTARSMNLSDIELLISGVVTKISKARIMNMIGHMALGLRGDGHLLTSDQQLLWWPSHMKDLAQVFALFLEAQYSDFFGGLEALRPPGQNPTLDLSEKGSDE